jgi:hypothetical protein
MGEHRLTYDNVGKALFEAVPELQEQYRKRLAWWGGNETPGQYIVSGFVLEPFLRELLDSEPDSILLKRIFDFFEEMARSPDPEVANLLQVGIFERLVGEKETLAVVWKHMGEETRSIARKTARIRRREQKLPTE